MEPEESDYLPKQDQFESIKGPTYNLAIINIVIFILTTIWGKSLIEIGVVPLYTLGLSRVGLVYGEFWTPITSMFVHSSLAHIGGNLIFLFVYGFKLEDMGYSKYGVYVSYLLTGLVAGLGSLPLLPFYSVSVGASGAIFGLLGTYVGVSRKNGEKDNTVIYAVIILFILASGSPNTNIFAHLIGLVSGVILGYSDFFAKFEDKIDPTQFN